MSQYDAAQALAWIAPSHQAAPAHALARIAFICGMHPDLFTALFTVLATHPGVPRDLLAAAISRCRRDVEAYSQEDIVGMMTAILNGGRQGFEAVLRTRKSGPKKNSALPWATD